MQDDRIQTVTAAITNTPDFPKPGIVFRDIMPLFRNPTLLSTTLDLMAEQVADLKIEVVVGLESRGFLFGPLLAQRLGVGFVPARKVGKLLPGKVETVQYDLEYGSDGLQMQSESISSGQSVLIVDDLVATGGSALAAAQLVEKLGANVTGLLFLSELTFLKPRKKLNNYPVFSVIQY